MATDDITEEIMIDIFSRIPAKSIGKCRCLSKQWRNILSTPQFIKSHHLYRKTLNQQSLLLLTPYYDIYSIAEIKNDAVSKKLELRGYRPEVLGSCDGLVLLETWRFEKFLVNPITQHKAKIPNSPPLPSEWRERCFSRHGFGYDSISMHGFGYDSSIDDYKIVTFSHHDRVNAFLGNAFVDVYYVKRGVWKRVENSPCDHIYLKSVPSSGAYLNGAIHWLANGIGESGDHRSVIAAFDLAREVFDEIPLPSDVSKDQFVLYTLVVLGGCLCMVVDRHDIRTDIWVMKEYGLAESWAKFSIDYDERRRVLKPLCYIGDEEVVMVTEEETLVVYNVKEGISRDMVVDGGFSAMCNDGGIFVESLISPDFSKNSLLY